MRPLLTGAQHVHGPVVAASDEPPVVSPAGEPQHTPKPGERARQAAFGALFTVALPACLLAWAAALDHRLDWSVPDWRGLGGSLAAAGAALMALSMVQLSRRGRGLPMSAYPPRDLVTTGAYAVHRHPIYLGAGLVAAGVALATRSPGGLYVVTPVFLGAMAAYVAGFERPGLAARFGDALRGYEPLLSLPSAACPRVPIARRAALAIAVLVPLAFTGCLIDRARCGADCSAVPGRWAGPQGDLAWALVWIVPAAFPAVRLLAAGNARSARRAAVALLLAALGAAYAGAVLPPLGADLYDPRSAAFVAAVLLGIALGWEMCWRGLLRAAEWVANSRTDWLFFGGRFRVVSHAVFAGLAGAAGTAIAGSVLDSPAAALLLVVFLLVGAAIFAQVLWGNRTTLLRPFGYWGGVLGSCAGAAAVWVACGIPPETTLLACVLAVPAGQGLGRLRCLAQGCCHGPETSRENGIVVTQRQSRVVVLSGMGGRPILPTQLYSILFNAALGPLLYALYRSESAGPTIIVGLYLGLTGIERFAEDALRAERQTRWHGPLRENQWIAIGALLAGMAISAVPSGVLIPRGPDLGPALPLAILLGGLTTAFALSTDFPKSNLRYSRLSG